MEDFLFEGEPDEEAESTTSRGFTYSSSTCSSSNLSGNSAHMTYTPGVPWNDNWYQWPYQQTTTWTNINTCLYCGGHGHTKPETCPRVGRIEYFETGDVRSIEFHKPER